MFLFLLLLFLAVGGFFFHITLNRNAKHGLKSPGPNPTPEGAAAFSGGFGTPEECAWFHDSVTDLNLQSDDGLKLHALLIRQDGNCHNWAIVCHGFTGFAREMARFAKGFYDLGCNVLLPDARAHGESEGNVRGMGWLDRKDILKWTEKILQMDPQANILLYGVSMGGATVMMASGKAKLPPQVKCIIEDCGYSSVWEEFATQMKALFHLPAFPILYAASLVTRLKGGYWLKSASSVEQVKKCKIPILFIHGDADKFVPYSMLDEVYEAAACEKERLVIPCAEHGKSSALQPEAYWNAIKSFCRKYFR